MIARAWTDPTFTRTVEGEPVPVPLGTYLKFVDAPDLTAAAARHFGWAQYEVRRVGSGEYRADDGEGARGAYRVLVQESTRRVVLSWGSHSGAILGTIAGSALTVMDFQDRGGSTEQRLTARVVIDSRMAAAVTRVLVPLFGGVIDRKLTEGFRTTARVADWATRHPREFCRFVVEAPLSGGRREQWIESSGCAGTDVGAADHVTR
jgi:hypothetical protein